MPSMYENGQNFWRGLSSYQRRLLMELQPYWASLHDNGTLTIKWWDGKDYHGRTIEREETTPCPTQASPLEAIQQTWFAR